ncbi:MAG: aspartate-semialdehyde dehydrogenase [Gemmatimonadales bacterium]
MTSAPRSKLPVAILGATGTVGQKFIRLLADHPWFEIAALTASPESAGKRYADAARWREPMAVPDRIAAMTVQPSDAPLEVAVAFSALDAKAAGPIEPAWARAGVAVVTNASPQRMDPVVPLIVPEVNHGHLALIERQRLEKGWSGVIVANPNCTTAGLVLALAPLHQAFGVDRLFVSTMQAISGAGWPGVASLDIVGNVIPFISGEEEKVEQETRKILDGPAIRSSVHTNRVPVDDGHTETVSVGFGRRVSVDEAREAIRSWRVDPEVADLPSTPAIPIEIDDRPDRPQPKLDRERGGGMTVTVGRLRGCPILDLRFVVLSHNTIRGAAGAAVQNAELLVRTGRVGR